MKRGGNTPEHGSPGDDNMHSAVQRIAGMSPGMPLQYADQTAVLQLGHFAPKAAIGAHVTRLLVETEADSGLSSSRLSEEVHKAAAAADCWSGTADEAELRAYDGKVESATSGAE
jgi:hypothetical protein